ncbi:MAG: ATP-binding protein, partial [Arenimonas sp.]
MTSRSRLSLAGRFAAWVGVFLVIAVLGTLALARAWPDDPWLVASVALLVLMPIALMLLRRQLRPMLSLFRALAGTVGSYKDGDFSFGLAWSRRDELGELVDAHNHLGDVLREQRLGLVQRELLLDTMVQNTPVAMLLVVDSGAVVYANLAARQLLFQGRRLEGHALQEVLDMAAAPLREALARGGDGLFSVGDDDTEEVYHLARRTFRLNGRGHELLLLRQLTAELRRQEVQTWKKVIRVISHELN